MSKLIKLYCLILLLIVIGQCSLTCEQQCERDEDFSPQCVPECKQRNKKSQIQVGIIIGSIFGSLMLCVLIFCFWGECSNSRCCFQCKRPYLRMKSIHNHPLRKCSEEDSRKFNEMKSLVAKSLLSSPCNLIQSDNKQKNTTERGIEDCKIGQEGKFLKTIKFKGQDRHGHYKAKGYLVKKEEGTILWFVKFYVPNEDTPDTIYQSYDMENDLSEITGKFYADGKEEIKGYDGTWKFRKPLNDVTISF